ncbi:hypothetical protein Desmer_1543 [Desulfosporosinus meridiei DSM 13257]|uniref:DUF1648 domain-containing protein n=1 Tax=Desulfosporosinus meridiei (strain ATCC BAA-275 / DSM 13257 / KCTC 12902 / NCIMB 13706 / S10) TaxID=768704 RepID=J7IPJ3_DESMD|nr:hypothetical protein Desmer_1543 [Desulfosporosinus meridiei DSM 13257]
MGTSQIPGDRHALQIPYTKREIKVEIVAGIGVVLIVIMPFLWWGKTPDLFPTNFGMSGKVDWEGKGSLVLLTGIGIGLYVLLTYISRFPNMVNHLWVITPINAEKQYRIRRLTINCIKVESVWLFVYLTWNTIQVAMSKAIGEEMKLLNQKNSMHAVAFVYKEALFGIEFLPIVFLVMVVTICAGVYYGNKAKQLSG